MSDLRGIPRRSRTALVAVLIVFLQVLALAFVGLRAIQDDRSSTQRELVRQNTERGAKFLDKGCEQAMQSIVAQLGSAFDVQRWEEQVRRRDVLGSASIVRRAFRADRHSTFYWLTPSTESYVVSMEAQQLLELKREADAARDLAQTTMIQIQGTRVGVEQRLDAWRRFLQDHPLHTPRGEAWLTSVAVVESKLLAALRELLASESPPSPDQIRGSLLQAHTVIGLNQDLVATKPADWSQQDLLARARSTANGVLDELQPEFGALFRRELAAFAEARVILGQPSERARLEGVLAAAIPVLQDRGPSVTHITPLVKGRMFAVRVDQGRYTILELDIAAMSDRVRSFLPAEDLSGLGMELGLEWVGGPATQLPAGPLIHETTLRTESVQLPLNAKLVRVREVVGEPEGRSEIFYWAIIGIAALGILFGGFLLWRLTTREVRLARLKADFVSNLSHELKTPLTSMGLFTEMLKEGKLESEADRQEAYEVIDQESARLQRIVHRMIDVARQETHGVSTVMSGGDLNRPVLAATGRFRRIVTEPGLDLRVRLSPEPLPMRLDAQALDDVITNLLSNAWKYKRGDAAQIEVLTVRRGRKAEVVVSDNGIGIPSAERKRVFEMFYRADQYLTQPVAGTGLGLALVRTIVRAHRGRVHIESGPGGQGTTFRLRFPLDPSAEIEGQEPSPQPQNGEP